MAGKITITSSGVPGGSDKQVQFNDSGAFGGANTMYWDKVNGRLGVGIAVPTSVLEVYEGNITISRSAAAPTLLFRDLADSDWFNLSHSRAGNRLTISSNDVAAGIFTVTKAGLVGIGDNTPAQQLSLTKCMELLTTTGDDIGIIFKGASRFIHDFHHPVGGGAIPVGQNVFIGENAGNFTMGSGATLTAHGSKNVGIGTDSLTNVTNGYSNVGIGYAACSSINTGHSNMGIGEAALSWTTVGNENIGIGRRSGHYNVSGSANVSIGTMAFRYNKGNNNVGIGHRAGYGVNGQTDVDNNVCVGYQSGNALLTGGDNNIFVGYQAGDNVTTGEKNVIIGYDLDALAVAGDNQLNIASTIFGDLGATKRVGVNTSTLNETLNVGGAIRLGTSALTNAGTIRWNGANFQGYKGAAWVNLDSSGSPGGANTQIQFNNSGVFGGDSDFCWTSGTNLLNLVNAQIQSKDNADADFTLVSTPLTHAWSWDYRACNFIQNRQSKVLATDGTSHSFAAGLALHHQDNDGTNYQTSGTIHQMYGLETHLAGTTTSASYKDMVGVFSRVMNRTEWNLRGCGGFITEVHQYGEGIADNEFHIFDPAAGAEGGHAQCKSSAGLQIVMHHHFADEDATHLARGLMIDVFGKRITAGITMSSNVDGAFGSGYMKHAIDMSAASTSDAAIKMPGSVAGNAGTYIEYDSNDWTWYDRTNNRYSWVAEGVTGLVVCGNVANAVAIRVNSTLLYISRSPDVDSLGQHYLTVT